MAVKTRGFRTTVKRQFSAIAVRFWEKVERIARRRRERRLATYFESKYAARIFEDVSFEDKRKRDYCEQHVTLKTTFLEPNLSEIDENLDHLEKRKNRTRGSANSNILEQSRSWACCDKYQNRCNKDYEDFKNIIQPSARPITHDINNLNTYRSQQKVRAGVYIHPQDITSIEGLYSSQKTLRCTREKDNTLDLDLKDLTDPQISSHSKDHPFLDVETFPVMFTWNKGGREVYLMGDFTRWKPVRMSGVEGAFVLTFHLPAGSYIYNFIVDDVMTHDERVRTVFLVNMKRNKVSVSRESNERTRFITDDWLWRRTYMCETG